MELLTNILGVLIPTGMTAFYIAAIVLAIAIGWALGQLFGTPFNH
jgi:hypothetical protein